MFLGINLCAQSEYLTVIISMNEFVSMCMHVSIFVSSEGVNVFFV